MNNPTTSEEITFEQQRAINGFVEACKNNPSNSNKALHALYTYINGLLEVQAAEFDAWKDQEVAKACKVTGETSDGYHTFNELYDFRKVYNTALFNEWAAQRKYSTYKSRRHHDGDLPFGGGWFVVGAQLPTGQITNHYKIEDWDLFIVPEVPRASEWDGHTPQDVLKRLAQLTPTKEEENIS